MRPAGYALAVRFAAVFLVLVTASSALAQPGPGSGPGAAEKPAHQAPADAGPTGTTTATTRDDAPADTPPPADPVDAGTGAAAASDPASAANDSAPADATADAGVPEAPLEPIEPLSGDELLAWLAEQSNGLRTRLDELDEIIAKFRAVPADTFIPPVDLAEHLECGDLKRPEVVEPCRQQLADRRVELARQIDEARARTEALRQAWTPKPPPRRRGRRRATDQPPPMPPVAQARIEYGELERMVLERESRLIAEKRAYLARTQPDRQKSFDEEDALQRQLQEEVRRAEEERARAEKARARALDEQKQARSLDESQLQAELARLENISSELASFDKDLTNVQREQVAEHKRLQTFRKRLLDTPDPDRRYALLVQELDRLQGAVFQIQLQQWHDPHVASTPGPRLSKAVRTLPPEFEAEVAELERKRRELVESAKNLNSKRELRIEERAEWLYRQAGELSRQRVALMASISAELRASMLNYDARTVLELDREFAHVTIEALHWLHQRHGQALHTPRLFTDLTRIGKIVWWLFELLLVLLVLRYTLRQWDSWMVAIAEFIGTNLDLAGWALLLVRLTDFARSFGPPLLVLLAAEIIYRMLGSDSAVPEVQVLYIFVFFIAGLRFQLRLVERIARAVGSHIAEREAREHYDSAAMASDDPLAQDAQAGSQTGKSQADKRDAGSAEPDEHSQAEMHLHIGVSSYPRPQPATELFIRCWRIITRYAAVALILLALAERAVGRAVFYQLATQILWWGSLPLAIYCLRVFRPWIVREYVKRSPTDGWLTELTRKHAPRFYGIAVLLVALIIVLFRQVARFVRSNLSDLDATKRLLAFFFRRRVEKHAQEHGRVLVEPHELPAPIIEHFPIRPLAPEARPIKAPFLDEIKEAFQNWQAQKTDGSVVLVGGAGMGKSTALRLLERTLGEPVPVYKVDDKYTGVQGLLSGLARLLEMPRVPTSVSAFVAELCRLLESQDRRVVALDNCHNFFLRKVGGFAAWEAFTRIVNQSSHRLFWVVSFNDVSWDYLSNIASGVSYFRRIVRIPPWTDEELRRMILTRMRRAKYRTSFTDLLVTRLEGMKESTQIVRTSQGYFRLLWDFTDGNPRIASHFWLRSLVPDPGKRRVRVHLFAAPRIEELEKLPDDIAFVLAAVVEHENINAEELATVSHTSIEFARFALQYCCERGYMWRSPLTDRAQLTTQWQQPIIRYLKRRHLLYS